MRSISLYQHRDTFVHRGFDPFTKLLYLLCSIIAAFFVPNFWGAVFLFLIHVALLAWARELGRTLKTIAGSLLFLLTIFIIQGLFNPANHTLVWKLGPIHFYREGLLFAVTISVRVINIIAASSVLILTTSPARVMEACVRRGLPAKIGYVTVSILQIIPTMMTSVARIREAQQSRGLALSGNVRARAKAFLPLLGPVVMSSFMSTQEKAMALEVRAFSVKAKKTFYHEELVLPWMSAVRLLMVCLTLAIVVWGIIQ